MTLDVYFGRRVVSAAAADVLDRSTVMGGVSAETSTPLEIADPCHAAGTANQSPQHVMRVKLQHSAEDPLSVGRRTFAHARGQQLESRQV
jgi:hypothetical protein